MNKKKSFTLPETLIACMILSMIAAIGISQISLVSGILYAGQTETSNRSELSEIIFFMTREIRSAEDIRISEDGKTIEIKETGRDGYNLVYSFVKGYPTDYLAFKGKKMIDADHTESGFETDGGYIKITFAVLKNSVDVNQRPDIITVSVMPVCKREAI